MAEEVVEKQTLEQKIENLKARMGQCKQQHAQLSQFILQLDGALQFALSLQQEIANENAADEAEEMKQSEEVKTEDGDKKD